MKKYLDVSGCATHFHEIAGVLMGVYDVFSGFKSFNAQAFWIKEFHKYEKIANTFEGKYCTLWYKERIKDATKMINKFTSALEYYKTHKATIERSC